MRVSQTMSSYVATVGPCDRAWSAAETLARLEITGMPVVDGECQVVGVISQLDLIRALRRGDDLHELTVADVMQPQPKYVEPDTDMEEAAGLMDEWQVHRLPVCHDGRLVGIISRGDVLRGMLLTCVCP